MMFKNKKEKINWALGFLYLAAMLNRLIAYDFHPQRSVEWLLVGALAVLVGVHCWNALRWRKKGVLAS